MPSQLVLSVRERATPGLNRGWRTPDPSPTRTSNGLPHCGASSWEVADLPALPDEDARDGSPDQIERVGGACADAARSKQGSRGRSLELELYIDDEELTEVTTPRGHDQVAYGPSKRGVLSSFSGDCSTFAPKAPPHVPQAWARIRTPSPEARTLASHAPPPPQGMAEKPPQWMPFRQHPLYHDAQQGATPDAAWARIRTPSPEARTLAPHAPSAWSQGMAEKPPQRMMPFWQPLAEAPPPPPAPAAAPAQRDRTRANAPRTATVMAKQNKKKKSCQPPACIGMPNEFVGVLSVGSVGHPYSCQDPCKYVRKTRGCKDGADCSHCHVCVWNRYEASRATRRA